MGLERGVVGESLRLELGLGVGGGRGRTVGRAGGGYGGKGRSGFEEVEDVLVRFWSGSGRGGRRGLEVVKVVWRGRGGPFNPGFSVARKREGWEKWTYHPKKLRSAAAAADFARPSEVQSLRPLHPVVHHHQNRTN